MDYDEKSLDSAPTMGPGGIRNGGARRPAEPFEEHSIGSAPTMGGRTTPQGGRLRPGDVLLGRYTVLAELGEGGMGVVYKCLDTIGGIEVAIKCLPPELSRNESEMEGIRENYAIVARLHHSAISGLRQLEKDSEFGEYYLVMDLAKGEDLSTILRRRRGVPMPLDEVLAILRPLASALDYAHGEHVLHRDVKPANVKVDGSRVQLLDFGLAAEVRSSMSRVSLRGHVGSSGTPAYMAPEQWEARRQSAATDQYSLAVMTYQMLSGYLPFDADDMELLKSAVLTRAPDPIEGIPTHVNAALQRALAKDPKARFASCAEFVDAISNAETRSAQRDAHTEAQRRGERGTGSPRESGVQAGGDAFAMRPQDSGPRRRSWRLAAVLLIGVAAVAVYHVAEEELKARERKATALSELADIRQAAESSVSATKKYAALDDALFEKRFELMNSAKRKLDAIDSLGELSQAHALLREIEGNAKWIAGNGPVRQSIFAKEEILRKLDSDLERSSAHILAEDAYNDATSARERARGLCESGEFNEASATYEEAEVLYGKAIDKAKTTMEENNAELTSMKTDANAKVGQANKYAKWQDNSFFEEKFREMQEAKTELDAIFNPLDMSPVRELKERLDEVVDWIVENGPHREAISAKEKDLRKLDYELERKFASVLAEDAYNEAKASEEQARTRCEEGFFEDAADKYEEAEKLYRQAIDEAKDVMEANTAELVSMKADANEKVGRASVYAKFQNDEFFREKLREMHKAKAELDAISNPLDMSPVRELKEQLDEAADLIVENGPHREAISTKEKDLRKLDNELERVSASKLASVTYNQAQLAESHAKALCGQGRFQAAAESYEEAEVLYGKAIDEAKAEQKRIEEEQRKKEEEQRKKEKEQRIGTRLSKASDYKNGGQWANCLNEVNAVLEMDPGNAKAQELRKEAQTALSENEKRKKEALLSAGARKVVPVGSQKIALRWCPATTSEEWKRISGVGDYFLMGSPETEVGREKEETQHRVTLTKGFWMGEMEVTQRLWKEVMGSTVQELRDKVDRSMPLFGEGDNYPMTCVSWNDCQEFVRKLNFCSPQSGFRWALPTEAQWEYACRAGTTRAYGGTGRLDDMGWYSSIRGVRPVGMKPANAWGLHDMHGNVWEWCQDWHGEYSSLAQTEPSGPRIGWRRIARGGSWRGKARECRSACRGYMHPGMSGNLAGFRIALVSAQ